MRTGQPTLMGGMRIPARSEREAVRLVVIVALLGMVSVLLALVAGPVFGIALFAVVVCVALVADLRSMRAARSVLREAARIGGEELVPDPSSRLGGEERLSGDRAQWNPRPEHGRERSFARGNQVSDRSSGSAWGRSARDRVR